MKKPSKKIVTYAIAAIVALGAIFFITHWITSRSGEQTKVITIAPFQNKNLASDIKDLKIAEGKCFSGSISVNRPDAWRCMEGNMIYDPCFADPTSNSTQEQNVVCYQNPEEKPVAVLKTILNPKLANREGVSDKDRPWAVELADGAKCTLFTGATAPINDQRINYGCKNGTILIGDFNKDKRMWTISSMSKEQFIDYMKSNQANVEDVGVKEVWR